MVPDLFRLRQGHSSVPRWKTRASLPDLVQLRVRMLPSSLVAWTTSCEVVGCPTPQTCPEQGWAGLKVPFPPTSQPVTTPVARGRTGHCLCAICSAIFGAHLQAGSFQFFIELLLLDDWWVGLA